MIQLVAFEDVIYGNTRVRTLHTPMYAHNCTAALFKKKLKIVNKPKCPSRGKYINKQIRVHPYYAAV